jgi:hypothetical protein
MYHAKYILPGLAVFVGILTLPIWLNLGSPAYRYPEVVLPAGAVELNGEERTGCVEPGEWMVANHMTLLLDWRDSALRESRRVYVAGDGRKWETSLQNTCMACHANKAEFCDKCHDTNSVNPYCWDCHIIPQGNNHEFE